MSTMWASDAELFHTAETEKTHPIMIYLSPSLPPDHTPFLRARQVDVAASMSWRHRPIDLSKAHRLAVTGPKLNGRQKLFAPGRRPLLLRHCISLPIKNFFINSSLKIVVFAMYEGSK